MPIVKKAKKSTTSSSKVSRLKESTIKTTPSITAAAPTDNLKKNRGMLILVGVLIILALLVYRYKSEYVVAIVNGKPITRLELINSLEKQAGSQALDGLIVQELIRQEAKKANIVVKKVDVDKQMNNLETQLKAQGQNLDEFLKQQGLKREDVRKQAELQIMLEKLTAKDVKVTQADIDKAFDEQKSILKDNKDMTEAQLREQIKKSLESQKKNAAVQAWIESARKQAKVTIYKQF